MHSPKPLSSTEILKVMPTNESISGIYNTMNERGKLEGSIPTWETLLFGENFIKLILILVFTGTKNTLFVL